MRKKSASEADHFSPLQDVSWIKNNFLDIIGVICLIVSYFKEIYTYRTILK